MKFHGGVVKAKRVMDVYMKTSSQLAEPLWTNPGLQTGISVRELISTLKKKKKKKEKGAGGEWIVKHSPKVLARVKKSHHDHFPFDCSRYLHQTETLGLAPELRALGSPVQDVPVVGRHVTWSSLHYSSWLHWFSRYFWNRGRFWTDFAHADQGKQVVHVNVECLRCSCVPYPVSRCSEFLYVFELHQQNVFPSFFLSSCLFLSACITRDVTTFFSSATKSDAHRVSESNQRVSSQFHSGRVSRACKHVEVSAVDRWVTMFPQWPQIKGHIFSEVDKN